MRILLAFTFVFLGSQLCLGQLKFDGRIVDSICIRSSSSVYNIGRHSSNSIGDSLTLRFVNKSTKENSSYCHIKEEINYVTYDKPTSIIKTKKKKLKNVPDTATISSFFNELKYSYYPIKLQNLGLDSDQYKSLVTKKYIKRIAKNHKAFDKDLFDDTSNNKILRLCLNVDSFNSFLVKTFIPQEGYIVTADFSYGVKIAIYTKGKNYNFEGNYPNLAFTPWHYTKYIGEGFRDKKTINIFNPMINVNLLRILPQDFYLLKQLSIENIIRQYIVDCLIKTDVISKYD